MGGGCEGAMFSGFLLLSMGLGGWRGESIAVQDQGREICMRSRLLKCSSTNAGTNGGGGVILPTRREQGTVNTMNMEP